MKKIFLLLCSLLATTGVFAQNDSLTINTYTMHGDVREKGMIGLRLDNGESAVFNLTSNCNTAQCAHGMAGIRIDNNGEIMHFKKFGHAVIDVDPVKAIWTTDKHILLVGIAEGDNRIVMKIDTNFTVVWARRIVRRQDYSGLLTDCLLELNNSYYMSFDNTFVKLKPDGTVVFSKIYGPEEGTTDDFKSIYMNTLTPLSGGRFFMGGAIDVGPLPWDAETSFMMIIDTNGTILKQKKFDIGDPWGAEVTYAFRQSENVIRAFGRYETKMYTAEIDTNLAITNVKKIEGAITATHTVHYNGTDQYVIGFSHQGITMIALNNNGNLDWAKSYTGGYSPYAVYSLNNCTYATYGSCNTNVPNYNKGYWLKITEDGVSAQPQLETAYTPTFTNLPVLSTGITTAVDSGQWQTDFTIQDFLNDNSNVTDSLWFRAENPLVCPDTPETPQTVYEVAFSEQKNLCAPNPFYGKVEISNDWELSKISELVVYDITGRVILEQDRPSTRTIEFTENIKGLIFVKWMYDGTIHTQKMLAL